MQTHIHNIRKLTSHDKLDPNTSVRGSSSVLLNPPHKSLGTFRCKRQFAPDDCYWGAEAYADEALVRLQQLIDNGSGTLASNLRYVRGIACMCVRVRREYM